jgi:hypothetical protein
MFPLIDYLFWIEEMQSKFGINWLQAQDNLTYDSLIEKRGYDSTLVQ